MAVTKGQVYYWRGVTVSVTRVAKDETWADIKCKVGDSHWTKRQVLPLSEEWILLPEPKC